MSKTSKRVDSHVGERMRERRTMLGQTQEQLSATLEISYQQVQKYETGSNRVSAGRLYEIATALNVDVAYFFTDLDTDTDIEPMAHGGANRSTIELAKNFQSIADKPTRDGISALVKALGNIADDTDFS